jgi:hypothetical protein
MWLTSCSRNLVVITFTLVHSFSFLECFLLCLGSAYKRSTYDITLSGSSYFNPVSAGLSAQQESADPTVLPGCQSSFVSYEKQAKREVNLQTVLPKTSSIGKRLEEFKHCHAQ